MRRSKAVNTSTNMALSVTTPSDTNAPDRDRSLRGGCVARMRVDSRYLDRARQTDAQERAGDRTFW